MNRELPRPENEGHMLLENVKLAIRGGDPDSMLEALGSLEFAMNGENSPAFNKRPGAMRNDLRGKLAAFSQALKTDPTASTFLELGYGMMRLRVYGHGGDIRIELSKYNAARNIRQNWERLIEGKIDSQPLDD